MLKLLQPASPSQPARQSSIDDVSILEPTWPPSSAASPGNSNQHSEADPGDIPVVEAVIEAAIGESVADGDGEVVWPVEWSQGFM